MIRKNIGYPGAPPDAIPGSNPFYWDKKSNEINWRLSFEIMEGIIFQLTSCYAFLSLKSMLKSYLQSEVLCLNSVFPGCHHHAYLCVYLYWDILWARLSNLLGGNWPFQLGHIMLFCITDLWDTIKQGKNYSPPRKKSTKLSPILRQTTWLAKYDFFSFPSCPSYKIICLVL